MTDRPIIFSAPMVRALLAGEKTQTRRLATSPLARAAVGDRLWVREPHWSKRSEAGSFSVVWAAEFDWEGAAAFQRERGYRLRPAILMPRWASRLTLVVEGVWIEPLQTLGEADAKAEGVPACARRVVGLEGGCDSFVCGYRQLWAKLHPTEGERWEDNPHVVALAFRVEPKGIDQP